MSSFCSDSSADGGESIAGTASRVEHWLLVEYRGVWGSDALAGSGLSDQVKAHLRAQIAALRPAKLLFVRRRERHDRESLTVFFGRSTEGDELLLRTEVGDYEELLELDFAAPGPPGAGVGHPLFLVCTHGKHDRCCAVHGRPVYEVLSDQAEDEWVWQVTHVGGDRFAGNVVVLPEGLYYGRLRPEDGWGLLDEHLARRIDLEHFRGRSTQPFAVQAAEIAVREQLELRGIGDLSVEGVTRDDGRWRVRLRGPERRVHEVELVTEHGPLTYLTCSSETLSHPPRYAVESLRESAA